MGNASEEVGKVVNPNRLGLSQLKPPDVPTPNLSFINEGIAHNLGELGKGAAAVGGALTGATPGQEKQEAQSAVGKYSSGRGESSKSSRRGATIEDKAKKKVKGKASLYARK